MGEGNQSVEQLISAFLRLLKQKGLYIAMVNAKEAYKYEIFDTWSYYLIHGWEQWFFLL